MLLHRKNDKREASSRSEIRYGLAAGTFAGSFSARTRNSGLANSRRSASFDAVVECTKPSPVPVEDHQRFDILIVDGPTIRFARERRKNLLGADWLLSGIRRLTNENLAQAWRSLRTLGKKW